MAAALLPAPARAGPGDGDVVDREGRIVWITEAPDQEQFPALYVRATQPRAAIVLLHDLGSFVDDPRLFDPLRENFVGQGYNVLIPRLPISRKVIQGGVLSAARYDSLLASVERRARRSIEFMRTQGQRPLLLLGHGYSAFVATLLLGRADAPQVAAFIGISPHWYAHPQGQKMYMQTLSKLSLPVLDIHPEVQEDDDNVQSQAHLLRRLSLQATGTASRQVGIPYTDHYMRSMVEPVGRIINNWLTLPGSGPELLPPPGPAAGGNAAPTPSPP